MENVENPIQTQEQNVVCGDVFDVFEFVDDCELWEDSEGFEPDAEGPNEIHGIEGFVDENGHEECSSVDVEMRKGV